MKFPSNRARGRVDQPTLTLHCEVNATLGSLRQVGVHLVASHAAHDSGHEAPPRLQLRPAPALSTAKLVCYGRAGWLVVCELRAHSSRTSSRYNII